MIVDKHKIYLLATLWIACILTTLLKSNSFYTGYGGLAHVPKPPLHLVCKIPRQQEKDCSTSTSSEEANSGTTSSRNTQQNKEPQRDTIDTTTATTITDNLSTTKSSSISPSSTCRERASSQVRRCERAATKAYAWIYMGGCPFQIQANTICSLEWCGGNSGSDRDDCERECKIVKDKLDACIQGNIDTYFNWEGLNSNGTVK